MNQCNFTGRIGNLELKYTPNGTAIMQFSLAVGDSKKEKMVNGLTKQHGSAVKHGKGRQNSWIGIHRKELKFVSLPELKLKSGKIDKQDKREQLLFLMFVKCNHYQTEKIAIIRQEARSHKTKDGASLSSHKHQNKHREIKHHKTNHLKIGMIKKYPSDPTRLTKGYKHYSVQGCKQEIDMTIEQLQEENEKLKEVLFAGAFLMAKAVHKYDFGIGMEEQATDFMKDAEELVGRKLPKFAG